jgi:hypothetical protein
MLNSIICSLRYAVEVNQGGTPVPLARGGSENRTSHPLAFCSKLCHTMIMKNKLTPQARAERAALAAERRLYAADNARINALYAQGSLNRLPATPAPEVPAPARYTVTVLPSAVQAQARAAKAAATRRRNRAAKAN